METRKAKHFIKIATMVLLTAVPLVFSFSFYDYYNTPKYFIYYTFICLCFPLALYTAFFQKETKKILLSPIGICGWIYVFFLLIAALASRSISISLKSYFETLSYIIAFLIWTISLEKKDTHSYIKAICYSGFLVALYSLFQHTGYELPWITELSSEGIKMRSVSSMGNPAFLAGYLAMIAPLYLYLFLWDLLNANKVPFDKISFNTVKHYIYPSMWVVCAIAVFLTYTRGSWVAFFISHIVLSILIAKYLWKENKKLIIGFVVLISMVISIIIIYDKTKDQRYEWYTLSNRLITLKNIESIYSSRLYAWKAALEIFKDNPLAGTGPGTFPYSYLKYRSFEPLDKRAANLFLSSCHNHFLETASSSGIGGLLSFCSLILMTLYCTIVLFIRKSGIEKIQWSCILTSLIAYIIHIIFLFPTISYEILWWFLLSLITMEYNEIHPTVGSQINNKKGDIRKNQKKESLSSLSLSQITILALATMISIVFLVFNTLNSLSDYYLNRALKVGSAGDYKTAMTLYDSAIAYRPSNASLYLYKARYLEDSLRMSGMNKEIADEVIILYSRAIQINPLDPYVWVNEGRFYQYLAEQGDTSSISKAEEAYNKAIALDPFNFLNYNYIATLYIMINQPEKSLQSFNKSISLYDSSELVHYNMAVLYLSQKNILLSKKHVEKALLLNPNYEKAKKLLYLIEKDQ